MTCATLERLVQALSTSHCSISNFETGHILTERCDEIGDSHRRGFAGRLFPTNRGADTTPERRVGVPFGVHVPRRRPAAATSSFTSHQRAPPPAALKYAVGPGRRAPLSLGAEPRRGREAFARK